MVSLYDVVFPLAAILILVYFYLTWNHKYWKTRGVASETPIPIFGNLFDTFVGKRPLGLIHTDIYNKFPGEKVVGWFKFGKPGLIVRDPALVRRVLLSDFESFRNNDIEVDENADPILGRNIFVLKDELWKKNRALITPAFTAVRIKGIYPMIKEVAQDFVAYLKKHPEELNVKNTMSRYTAEVAARCGFGIQGDNFKDPVAEMHEMGKAIFGENSLTYLRIMMLTVAPFLSKLLGLKMVSTKVQKFFQGILRDVIVYRQENKVERNDFVQFFLDIKKKSQEVANGTIESEIITKVYSDDDVLTACVMFFIESFETTALSLANVLYFLAKHHEVQEKLRNEVESALDEGELNFEKLNGLSYMNSVVLETSRKLPVVYTLQKVCTERYEMEIGRSKPLVIEKGTPVTIPLFALHNDPAHWEEPEVFKPERFANKEDGEAKAKGIFLPFGDGPRMCPGMRAATTILKLGLAHIVKEFDIYTTSKTPDKIDFDPTYFLLSNKGGIHLRFAERNY